MGRVSYYIAYGQIGDSRCIVGVTSFFPLFSVFLAVITDFAMGNSISGVVSTVSWIGGGSSGLRGFNPVAVTWVASVPAGGTRYQIGISNDMLGNTSIAKTYWEMKPAGR